MWGAFSKLPPDDATFKIAFQNVRGLPFNAFDLMHEKLFQTMKECQADIFGCVETNVDWMVGNKGAKVKWLASKI